MASYAELQTDVAAWLVAEDISAQIPSFIALAEERHKWGIVGPAGVRGDYGGAIRVRDMERRARTAGNGTNYLPMPERCLEHRSIAPIIEGMADRPLQDVGSANIARAQANNRSARPVSYCVERNEFRFDFILQDTAEVELIYYESYLALSDANPTNWLLENVYAAYLYGSLCETEPYLRDDERVPMWEAKYAAAVKAVNDTERRAQRSRSSVTMKPLRAMP